MKLLVLSDSHGRIGLIQEIIEKESYDKLIFLGDGLRDFEYINDEKCIKIAGNCDLFSIEQKEVRLKIEDVQLLATHGHLYRAKLGPFGLIKEARARQVDLLLYGHTHEQKIEIIDGVKFVNPGSVANGKYAIIEIIGNQTTVELKSI